MIIPIRTDRRLERTPWVNYALIVANILVFVFFQRMGAADPVVQMHMLHPDQPELFQFFSSVFMHGNLLHLVGNMVFLWVFGNAVNDTLGHVGYLAFYLAGGVIAGVGYVVLSGVNPVLGASGAISAVTGAFLVLFPRVRVTVLVLLIYVLLPWEVSSLFFIALQIIWNLLYTVGDTGGNIAYWAHLSGYAFGIVIAAILLATKLLPRDVYDMLSLVRMWRRRKSYRRMVAAGYDPFSGPPARMKAETTQRRWVDARTVESAPTTTRNARELELRRQIGTDHANGNFPAAAGGYLKLVQVADEPILPLNQQLDVANYLMSAEQYPAAADAYERFLVHYGGYEYVADILLMLGLIYSRYLHQYAKAEANLAKAVDGLFDSGKAVMAREELEKVRRQLG